jgi:hypothetical protein
MNDCQQTNDTIDTGRCKVGRFRTGANGGECECDGGVGELDVDGARDAWRIACRLRRTCRRLQLCDAVVPFGKLLAMRQVQRSKLFVEWIGHTSVAVW